MSRFDLFQQKQLSIKEGVFFHIGQILFKFDFQKLIFDIFLDKKILNNYRKCDACNNDNNIWGKLRQARHVEIN